MDYVIAIYKYMYSIVEALTSVLQESQGLTTNAFDILPISMISPNMPMFRSVVAMVAEFRSLVILIHNTLLGEIMISSTRTTRVNENIIPLFLNRV